MKNIRGASPDTTLNRSPLLNQLCHPLIQRQASRLGSRRRCLMDAGIKAQHKFAGMPFERLNPLFFAHLQKHLERSFAFMFQTVNIFGIKIGTSVQTDKFTAKHFNVGIVLNDRPLSFNHHHVFHGCTPFSINHLRIDSTAPLSVREKDADGGIPAPRQTTSPRYATLRAHSLSPLNPRTAIRYRAT